MLDSSSSITLGFMIAILGCFIGLSGWLKGRDTKISTDSEWRGEINAKLDIVVGLKNEVSNLNGDVIDLGKKVVLVEQSVKSAHHRIDEHVKKETK